MGLTEEVSRVVLEIHLLGIQAELSDPRNILYQNEVRRMMEETESLHRRAKAIDEFNPFGRFNGVPEYRIVDIRREIELISNNIIFLRRCMAIDSQNRTRMWQAEAQLYQTTYSSSECQSSQSSVPSSPSTLNGSSDESSATSQYCNCSSRNCSP